jgi:CheY-like chemotaxis protein
LRRTSVLGRNPPFGAGTWPPSIGMLPAAASSMSATPLEPNVATSGPEFVSAGSRAPAQLTQAKLEVLVVDDEQEAGDGLARLVRSFGHGCRVASGGDNALRVMAEGRTDVVISDWDMPGMSGAELCKRIRVAADDAPYTYFIFLSGFDDREHRFAGMEAGADHYQRKPVDFDELEAQLISAARLIERHRRLAARLAEAMRVNLSGGCNRIVPTGSDDA